MAAWDLAIPEELYRITLKDDDEHHGKDPSDRESRETVHGEAHPPIREHTNVEEENCQNDEAYGRGPCKLLHKNTLTVGEQ